MAMPGRSVLTVTDLQPDSERSKMESDSIEGKTHMCRLKDGQKMNKSRG